MANPVLMPVKESTDTQNQKLFDKSQKALKELFPIETSRYRVSISNIRPSKPLRTNFNVLKDALLKKSSITVPILADVKLSILKTNKSIQELKGIRIMSIPIMTELRTFVLDGIQYATTNQLRLRPGVYTKKADSGETVAFFNLGKGQSFRIRLEPDTGIFYWQIGTAKKGIALYPVLRKLGMSDSQIGSVWGQKLLEANRMATAGKADKYLDTLYKKYLYTSEQKAGASEQDKVKSLLSAFDSRTELDPETTKSTLGTAHSKLNPQAILDSSKKILGVFQEKIDEDERDSLEYKKVVTIDDFFYESLVKERGRKVVNKIKARLNAASGIPDLARVVSIGAFSSPIRNFLATESITGTPDQINPIELMDQSNKITPLGPGGIPSTQSVSNIQRMVHGSHLGILDPIRTPENVKAGIDLRLISTAGRDKQGNLYAPFVNVKTGKYEYLHPSQSKNKIIAFENPKGKSELEAMYRGEMTRLPANKITHFVSYPDTSYGDSTNLIPFLGTLQGNRTIMGSKQVAQALPLLNPESPLVQTYNTRLKSTNERIFGKKISISSGISGVVTRVNPNEIVIKDSMGKFKTSSLRNNLPLNSKTFLHDTPIVKIGDKVKSGQVIASSNFTKDGTLALGRNLRVAYMPFRGLVHEDSVIVSETAAKKLTSTHMYKKTLDVDKNTILDKSKFRTFYPNIHPFDSYDNLDERGVARKGATIEYGQPVIMALRKSQASSTDILLGRLHKSLSNLYKDASVVWDKNSPGVVSDVKITRTTVVVTLKVNSSAEEGDKLGGRYGNKGVIAKVLPDAHMPQTPSGPAEVLMTPIGVVGRINPGQILETAVSKVAEKIGKPIEVNNFDGQDKVQWAKALLKKYGVKDKEDVIDPLTGKKIKGVMVGKQYILKLHKTVDTNFSARSTGGYDQNQQPTKGGISGSKGLGMMEVNALLAHNARNILKEVSTIKSQRNDEYWNAVRTGQPLPSPSDNFAFNKFTGMLQGMNVKVDRKGDYLSFSPMTDRDVLRISAGEIKNAKQVKAKDLTPERDGMFDFGKTGGIGGKKWSHISLNEPIVNPLFEEPVQRFLGYKTKDDFNKALVDKGGSWFKKQLAKIDINKKEQDLLRSLPTIKRSQLDNTIKQLKYTRALKENNLRPQDAYIMSKVPVIPPMMRPIQPSRTTGDLMISGPNYLYRDTILFNDVLRDVKKTGLPDKEIKKARASLQASVASLQGLTKPNSPQLQNKNVQGYLGILTGGEGRQPKEGFIQSSLLSRNADMTGRGTASPDPNLAIDQIGLPNDQAWTMFEPFVMRKLTQSGFTPLDAKSQIEKRTALADKFLDSEMKNRPVLINRAPTLWRSNIIAAYPKRVPGKVLKVQPLIEAGMNLDYDGDALTLHVPVEPKAVEEARKMTIRTNFFSDKIRDDLLVAPSQEPVLGLWGATKPGGRNTNKNYVNRASAWEDYISGNISLNDSISVK